MAIRFATGFDWIPQAVGASVPSAEFSGRGILVNVAGSSPRCASGRLMGKALQFTDWNASIVYSQLEAYTQGAIGIAAIHVSGLAGKILQLTDVNGISLQLGQNGTNSVLLNYDPAGTGNDINVTIPVPTGVNVFNFYEIRWTSSLIEVAINNFVVYTKVQTAQPAFITMQTFGQSFNVGPTVDDVYLADDATFRGDCRVNKLSLTATAINTGTVVGAANAHTALSSADSDTSYVSYTADGQKTVLDLEDITDNPATIHAVMLSRQARKSDTGNVSESLLLTTASEQTVGGVFNAFPLAYFGRRVTVTSDPHDSSAWTKAKVNSLQAGVKRGV